jgi:hypothetical protein
VFQVSLLGAIRKKGKTPDLLYAITSHQPEEEIKNIIQISACILSQSRNIFFGKILAILRCFDPRKVEICYGGWCESDGKTRIDTFFKC